MKKKLMSIACAGLVLLGASGVASASGFNKETETSGSAIIDGEQSRITVNVGGGSWSYGTNEEIYPGQKYAWSNYNHPSRTHASSVTLDGKKNDSGPTKAGVQSKASIVGTKWAVAQANWRYAEF